jgi:hypothetical protein
MVVCMPRGPRPNLKRREQMSLAQIGKRLGISRQRVQKALALQGKLRVVPIRCRECGPATPRSANGSRHAACLLGAAAWDTYCLAATSADG